MLRTTLMGIWIVSAAVATAAGLDYYATPLQDRPFTEAHDLFASSGLVGHGYGVLGSAFMAFGVVMYSARKRLSLLAKAGRLKHWLQTHIFLCTLGPFLVLLHSAFKIRGLVAISFWSMVLVVASGVFGRYIYVRIPKNAQGAFLSLQEAEGRTERGSRDLEAAASLDGAILARLHRMFRYWHAFHLPLAIVMFLVLAVHVSVAVLFGYAWIL